ncbi:hypothetical protein [Macrococcoides bohemicum]|uniref:hypothetical protein n=1 Tax=Macrococcoides bohemicum TaxID=1903056 RepID=UPI00165E8037|nr:hypothetical protein [Macrococcus bohemicus]MBC9873665.1 hypothetical protein [Macrococcus bohemicus]
MITVSFTQFLNFAVKSGASRISVVKNIKNADDYHPGKDYWKEFRDSVRKIHLTNQPIDSLDNLLATVSERKKDNYRKAINKYKSFFKGKDLEWFDPPKASYNVGDLKINVNHELGLYINGIPYIIKLLISKDASEYALQKNLKTTLALSNIATEYLDLPDNCRRAVLDVQRNKLHLSNHPSREEIILLNNEMIFFQNVYNDL